MQVWRRAKGVCEECHRVIVGQGDCHHVIPVETGRTVQEMERLCYDVNNVRLLCVPCHIKVHQNMYSHTKEKVRENKKRRSRRFLEMNDPNYKVEDNGTGTMETDSGVQR